MIACIAYFLNFTLFFALTFSLLYIFFIFCTSSLFLFIYPVLQTWQWEAGALAVLLSWLELTMIMRRIKDIGIYIVMYVHIIHTFVKVALSLIFALFGFAFCFHMLLANQVNKFNIASRVKIVYFSIGHIGSYFFVLT